MPVATANGKEFEFPEGTTSAQMGEAIDWFFSQNSEPLPSSVEEDIPYIDQRGQVQYSPGLDPGIDHTPDHPRTSLGGMTMAGVAGLNRGAMAVADLPSNALNLTSSVVGGPKLVPTASDLVNMGGEAVGVGPLADMATTPQDYAQDTPQERFTGRVAEELGAGGGMVGGMRGATRNVKELTDPSNAGHVRSIADAAKKTADDIQMPVREFNAALGGGTGAAMANEIAPGSAVAEGVGAVLGSGVGVIPGPVKKPFRMVEEQLVEPMTDAGNERRVSQFLRESAADPERAVHNMEVNRILVEEVAGDTDIPTTLLMQDEGIERAIQAIASKDAKIFGIIARGSRSFQEALLKKMDDTISNLSSPQDMSRVVSQHIDGITQRLKDQIALTKQKMEDLMPDSGNIEDLSLDFTGSLQAGYKQASLIERKVWKRVDRTEAINLTPLKARIAALGNRLEIGTDDAADIPTGQLNAARNLGRDPNNQMGSLLDFRSNVLRARREALGQGKENRARLLTEIDQELNRFIDSNVGSDAYRSAAAYTRLLNETYTKGPFGRLLGIDKTGAKKIDGQAALDAIVVPKGRGAARMEDVKAVEQGVPYRLPAVPGLSDPVKNMLSGKWRDAPNKATMARNFGPALRAFPTFNRNLLDLGDEIEALAGRMAQLEGRATSVMDTTRAKVGILLGSDPDRIFETVSSLPRADLRAVTRLLEQEGVEGGLQQAVLRHFMDQYTTKGAIVRGKMLPDLLKNPNNRIAFEEVLTEGQRKAMREFDETSSLLQTTKAPGTASSTSITQTSVAMKLISKWMASSLGSRLYKGDHGLIMAGAAAKAGQAIADNIPAEKARALIEKALLDPDLMARLMNPTLARNPEKVDALLRGHLQTIGFRADDEE